MDIFEKRQKTEIELAGNAWDEIATVNAQALLHLKESLKAAFLILWQNDGASPQKILDAGGTKAAQLFIASQKVQLLIKELDPSFELMPSPTPVTINQDGTVVVNNP